MSISRYDAQIKYIRLVKDKDRAQTTERRRETSSFNINHPSQIKRYCRDCLIASDTTHFAVINTSIIQNTESNKHAGEHSGDYGDQSLDER